VLVPLPRPTAAWERRFAVAAFADSGAEDRCWQALPRPGWSGIFPWCKHARIAPRTPILVSAGIHHGHAVREATKSIGITRRKLPNDPLGSLSN
jgi:hypothetical protein